MNFTTLYKTHRAIDCPVSYKSGIRSLCILQRKRLTDRLLLLLLAYSLWSNSWKRVQLQRETLNSAFSICFAEKCKISRNLNLLILPRSAYLVYDSACTSL